MRFNAIISFVVGTDKIKGSKALLTRPANGYSRHMACHFDRTTVLKSLHNAYRALKLDERKSVFLQFMKILSVHSVKNLINGLERTVFIRGLEIEILVEMAVHMTY